MKRLIDRDRNPLRCRKQEWVRTPNDSKRLNGLEGPMIIISASGMATGGRVLHHLAHRLGDSRTTVLLVGFQAEDTRGRKLLEGAKWLRIFGHDVPVHAQVRTLNSMSAHADQSELLRWLGGFKQPPKRCYLVHGEPHASQALAEAIKAKLGWEATLPKDGEVVPLR
jgi:metallo-beta-lactamase family protein